jgi:hypothetical protein
MSGGMQAVGSGTVIPGCGGGLLLWGGGEDCCGEGAGVDGLAVVLRFFGVTRRLRVGR